MEVLQNATLNPARLEVKHLYQELLSERQLPSLDSELSINMTSMLDVFGSLLINHLNEIRNMTRNISTTSLHNNELNSGSKLIPMNHTVDIAGIIEAVMKKYDEQSKRMLRPLLMPELAGERTYRWEKWQGTFKIQNIGNSAAVQTIIKIKTNPITGSKTRKNVLVWEKRLPFVKNSADSTEVTASIEIPVSTRSIVTQHPVRLSYKLEIYWKAIYEDSYARTVLPFYLVLDRSGDAKIRTRSIEIDWEASI